MVRPHMPFLGIRMAGGRIFLLGFLIKPGFVIQQPVGCDGEGSRQQGQLGDFGGRFARFPYLKILIMYECLRLLA